MYKYAIKLNSCKIMNIMVSIAFMTLHSQISLIENLF
jgi:hypothetical protein